MTLRLNGSTSGYTEIDAPAAAGSNTLVLPTGNGSAGNILGTDGSGNLSWVNGRMVLATSQASTSGTSIDFTSIPSWVKRVTVMLNGVSTNGTSPPVLQLGTSAGIANTGYNGGNFCHNGTASNALTSTTDFRLGFNTSNWAAARVASGIIHVATIGSNVWTANGQLGTDTNIFYGTAGSVTLSGTLDRIRITTANGTDTFDAGSINILYEG